jgi:hypothetical protein
MAAGWMHGAPENPREATIAREVAELRIWPAAVDETAAGGCNPGLSLNRYMVAPIARRIVMIRTLAFAAAGLAALVMGGGGAAAQYRPWCLYEPGLATTCIYYTFEQCLAARVGSTTYCAANPNYGGAPGAIPATRDRRR